MAEVPINGGNGGALLIVNGDGTTNVWKIPRAATITVLGQRGFGDAEQVDTSDTMTAALETARGIIGQDGAQDPPPAQCGEATVAG